MKWKSNVFDVRPKDESDEEKRQPDIIYRDSYGKKIKQDVDVEPVVVPVVVLPAKAVEKQSALMKLDPMYKEKTQETTLTYTESNWSNRFNIIPGYRWDGIDRSNGFENRYIQAHSKEEYTSYRIEDDL